MAAMQVIWSNSAKAELRIIYNYYRYVKKTPQGANKVRDEILKAGRSVIFKQQYEKDEIQPQYRRIIVRHFKLLDKEIDGRIVILSIFNTFQNPKRQLDQEL